MSLRLVALAALLSQAAAAVIGIDFGARFVKVGIIQPGKGIDLVLNEAPPRRHARAETRPREMDPRSDSRPTAPHESGRTAGRGLVLAPLTSGAPWCRAGLQAQVVDCRRLQLGR